MSEVLSLKVMSLSHSPVDPQTSTLKLLPSNISNGNEESLCIDNMFPLLLPTSQCRLYSGESFHAFLSISNSSVIKANAVVLKVELVGVNKTHLLYSNEENNTDIDIGDSMNIVIKERVDEVGLYSLICHLFFTSNEVRLTQKKSYKFSVLSPFNIIHRMYNADKGCLTKKTGYIEVSLENVSHHSLSVSDISLTPLNLDDFPGLQASIESLEEDELEPILIYSKCKYNKIFSLELTFSRGDFCKRNTVSDLKMSLKVVWKSKTFGEAWLDSYRIDYQVLSPQEIASVPLKEERLAFEVESPSVMNRQEEFCLKLHIKNNLPHKQGKLMVKLDFDRLLPIVVLGSDTFEVPEMDGNETKTIELSCMSLVPGVHCIDGISLHSTDGQVFNPEQKREILII